MTTLTPADHTARLQAKVKALGGTIPAPWPWAIYGKRGSKLKVDAPLYNLQLLELIEDLQRERNHD